ncbi:MAG: amidohydrolase family protein [Dehalococcoidia bacterium]
MIIDAHAHTNGADHLAVYKSLLLSGRGAHGRGATQAPEDKMQGPVKNHIEKTMDAVGTDIQFLSPRPFQLMHSEKPEKIVHWYVEASNNAIATTLKIAPDRYQGVAALPQCPSEPITATFDEIDRSINDLGFIGILINPDPYEGDGQQFPGMGDEYWYPLYEKMEKMDIPALVHSAACKDPWDTYSSYFIATETRCIISMVSERVFEKFPKLKIVVSHGGGAVPYQLGRYQAFFGRHDGMDFQEELKKFYFDTCLYNKEGLELLFKIVGTDRCMFGTENPGTGSYKDPRTGKMMDDTKPIVESIDWLTEQDKKNIFEETAKKAYTRFKA